jgi:hypothetical protein
VTVDKGANGQRTEGAAFAGARIGGSRRPPVFFVGWLVVLGSVVAVGLSGRPADPATDAVARATEPAPAATVALTAGPRPVLSRRFDPAYPSLIVSAATEPGPIQFEAVRSPSSISVHGATNTQQVVRVMVTVQSPDGQLAGSTSTRIRGPNGDGGDHLPPQWFFADVPMPPRVGATVVVVKASAYDTGGRLVATARVWLDPEA